MQTNIPFGDPQAILRYSAVLAAQIAKSSFWTRFTGTSENSIVHEKVDLRQAAGDRIQFDLSMALRGDAVFGDDYAQGKGEPLDFMIDEVRIDQVRKPADAGGRMSRKRTQHELRTVAKDRLTEWFSQWKDELLFCYASGTTGAASANEDKLYNQAAFANNPVEAPDAFHIMYGGDATAFNNIDAADRMSMALIQRANVKCRTLSARNPQLVDMKPVRDGARDAFVVIMSEEQHLDLRTGTGTTEWLEITKAAGVRGNQNPIYTEQVGMIGDASLHKHTGVRRFTNAGAGGNVQAARALYLGRQALTCAYGTGGSGNRMMWSEEITDHGNRVEILGGMIFGCKKTRYKPKGSTSGGTDFGVIALDTAAAAVV